MDDPDFDPLLRPVWETTPDETDDVPAGAMGSLRPKPTAGAVVPTASNSLFYALAAASDALGRLDARTASAPEDLQTGLLSRLAFSEAAGWLSHARAWIHPLDLALQAQQLTARTTLAAFGAGARALPNTFAGNPDNGWDDADFAALAQAEQDVASALALARLLPRLPGGGPAGLFASASRAAGCLTPLGAAPLQPLAFAAWWTQHMPPAVVRRRSGHADGEGPPALLTAAEAAADFASRGISANPAPLTAVTSAVGLLAQIGPARAVFVPVWAAYPVVGFGDRSELPRLRTPIADRLVGRYQPLPWPIAFLHLITESARAGLRELDRLTAAMETGQRLATGCDRRSRMPDAIAMLLRIPVLTPKALAARLAVAPQTATGLLRDLQSEGFVREVTGRGSFRAFAI